MLKTLRIQTQQRTEVINMTREVSEMIDSAPDGLALVYAPHTTVALLLCEDDDELRHDLIRAAESWLAGCRPFTHNRNNNPNSEAHILSAFGGTRVVLAIESGKPDLGRYQHILLVELDGPKEREVRCQMIAAQGLARKG
jgi:secondary thiamine-phosphate synthase enzyme